MRRDEKRHFLIDDIKCLCDNDGFHRIKARKDKYIPGNITINEVNIHKRLEIEEVVKILFK